MKQEEINIGLMTLDFILWRCINSGPFTEDTIAQWDENSAIPWLELYKRNVPLLIKLTKAYGACAIIARDGDKIIGQLRFYPKTILQINKSNVLDFCLQQQFPHGPDDNILSRVFPAIEEMEEKTLVVHCITAGSSQHNENSYRRTGIGTRMVQFMIEWARNNGWTAIEARTHENVPLLYSISGNAGRSFWEKLGFHVSEVVTEKVLEEENDFTEAVRDSARQAGIDPILVSNAYIMRLNL